jgi:putative DNA primase/helicase
MGKEATGKKIEAMLKLLKAFLAVQEAVFVPDRNMICMRNGTLNTATYRLEDHSPNHGLKNRLDIEWDEAATCPTWQTFLAQIFEPDADRAEKIAFLQQWFGYCLTPDVSQHKFVWMVGAGGNGKSVLLNVLQQLVGPDNVGNAQIERFQSGAVRAELEGKLLNISSEMSADATVSDSYLKAITGGDTIEAERKFKSPHKFKPYARIMASTNNLPRLSDTSDGFARRAVILKFNRQFGEQDKDSGLEEKLLKELPGIAVWAIEGLKQLRSATKFTIPPSSVAELQRYRTDSDPVALFAEEALIRTNERGPTPGDLFEIFKEWAKMGGFAAMNKVTFGKRLSAQGFVQSRSSGKSYWNVEVNASVNWRGL